MILIFAEHTKRLTKRSSKPGMRVLVAIDASVRRVAEHGSFAKPATLIA